MDHNSIPLIPKTYDLHKNLYQVLKTFPKGDKYNLGNEIKMSSINLLELFLEAEATPKEWKTPLLDKASIKLSMLKLFIRLANDIGIIDQKKMINIQEQLQEVGRMLGGWRKFLTKT
jgi:four helix bundle protein